MADYPKTIMVRIDGIDVTQNLFGSYAINPTDEKHFYNDIDITPLIRGPGNHYVEVLTTSGAGQVEARIEVR